MRGRPVSMEITEDQKRTAVRLRDIGYDPRDIAWELRVSKSALSEALGIDSAVSNVAAWRSMKPERDEALVRRYQELLDLGNRRPLTQVGSEFGITRERARQIIVGHETREGDKVERVYERNRRLKSAVRPPKSTVAQCLLGNVRLEGECWIWSGATHVVGGRRRGAFVPRAPFRALGQYPERVAFKLWRGPLGKHDFLIPNAGCGNWLCVNPWHRHVETPLQRFQTSPAWDQERGCWKHNRRRADAD